MGRPVILSDNLFNPRIYPSHTLAAQSTASGYDVLEVGSGRRIRELVGWRASDLNTLSYVTATCDQPRAVDLLFIDRDHNLATESLSVRISDDGFSTYSEIGPKTVPSAPVPMSALYDGEIVMTDEGALLWWLDLQVGWAFRVVVAAMGAGLRPEIAGLSLGKLWTPEHAAIKPGVLPKWTLTHAVERSVLAQDASGESGVYQCQDLRLRMASWDEYLEARYPLEELYLRGRRPTVVIPDDEQAERAFFVRAMPGQQGFEVPQGQFLPEITLPLEETQPLLVA